MTGSNSQADFSEGWHRDTRWHGGSDANQQDKATVAPDWSPEAERGRWAELQEQLASKVSRPRGLAEGGVSMFMALVEDGGCHGAFFMLLHCLLLFCFMLTMMKLTELVPKSHREWRKDSQYEVLRRLNGTSGHAPMEDAVAIRLAPGQGLLRDGVTIHRGRNG